MQDPIEGTSSIRLGTNRPSVFAGLDDDSVVVGFFDMSPLQVWGLLWGRLVREFEGKGQKCESMINLPGGRIAAGWSNGAQFGVAVFDAATGKQLQELTGFRMGVCGLALVEDHLLTMCDDKTLRVWSQDAAGKVCRQCVCRRGKWADLREACVCAVHLSYSLAISLTAARLLDPTLLSSKVH